jgi:hypothetical protein
MLNITYDSNRPIEEGQYYVELAYFVDGGYGASHLNNLGYWCDKEHLKEAIVKPALKAVSNDILDKILD